MNTNLLAFSLGGPEIILVFLIVLLLFGAKKLPKLARGIGQASSELKKGRREAESEIKKESLETKSDIKEPSEGS